MRRESRKGGGVSADTMAEAQSHDKVRGLCGHSYGAVHAARL